MTEEKKEEFWKHFIEAYPHPRSFTKKRLEKVKPVIFRWDFFWQDVVESHSGLTRTPEQLQEQDPFTYDHCMGNMVGMIHEALVKTGIMK